MDFVSKTDISSVKPDFVMSYSSQATLKMCFRTEWIICHYLIWSYSDNLSGKEPQKAFQNPLTKPLLSNLYMKSTQSTEKFVLYKIFQQRFRICSEGEEV